MQETAGKRGYRIAEARYLSESARLQIAQTAWELRREDMRQDVAVSARLENRDMGSAMAEIRDLLSKDTSIPPGTLDFGGLYEQQQKSFQNLIVVLVMAVVLVFTVLLVEFRGFFEPIAIVREVVPHDVNPP